MFCKSNQMQPTSLSITGQLGQVLGKAIPNPAHTFFSLIRSVQSDNLKRLVVQTTPVHQQCTGVGLNY